MRRGKWPILDLFGVRGWSFRAKNGVRVLPIFPLFPAFFTFSHLTTPHNTHTHTPYHTQIGQVAEEHAAAQQEGTQLQGLISSKCVVQNTSCCGSQFSGSRIVRLSESVGRNNGTHIDVQRPRYAHGRSGTGRCERSSRCCGPTRIGQTETSGHQLFVDPRESSKG